MKPKVADKRDRGLEGPPAWDFRKYGLLYQEDIDGALKLQREDPAAFKSSLRAQEIVAWAERSATWQLNLGKAFEKSILQPFRDFWAARDSKRKPQERLAAFERFARLFQKIPMNVAVALFSWLNGGPISKLIEALNRQVTTLIVDPKTGDLAERDGRGRKTSLATKKRIGLGARLTNAGVSKRKMATKLYPDLPQEQAYARTRDFFLKYGYLIERTAYRLRRRSQPSERFRR